MLLGRVRLACNGSVAFVLLCFHLFPIIFLSQYWRVTIWHPYLPCVLQELTCLPGLFDVSYLQTYRVQVLQFYISENYLKRLGDMCYHAQAIWHPTSCPLYLHK